MRELGVRQVPVLARGKDYVLAQSLQEVAKFVGLKGIGYTPLKADELVARYLTALHAAGRYLRQIPPESLDTRAIDIRDRSIRVLGHHVFCICEAFLETVMQDAHLSLERLIREPAEGEYTTREAIAQYGEDIIRRLNTWWAGAADDASRAREVSTFYGMQTVDQLLERCTWHSAQHVRQLMDVLERLGIEPDGRITARDLAGLPLPRNIWD